MGEYVKHPVTGAEVKTAVWYGGNDVTKLCIFHHKAVLQKLKETGYESGEGNTSIDELIKHHEKADTGAIRFTTLREIVPKDANKTAELRDALLDEDIVLSFPEETKEVLVTDNEYVKEVLTLAKKLGIEVSIQNYELINCNPEKDVDIFKKTY